MVKHQIAIHQRHSYYSQFSAWFVLNLCVGNSSWAHQNPFNPLHFNFYMFKSISVFFTRFFFFFFFDASDYIDSNWILNCEKRCIGKTKTINGNNSNANSNSRGVFVQFSHKCIVRQLESILHELHSTWR